jgi:predicted RNA-binding Zn-ribbon protein involved in translation (DUF1610 family)
MDSVNLTIKTPMQVVRVELVCPKCGEGKMASTNGPAILSSPPQYPHKCDKCGHEDHVRGYLYPSIEFEEVSNVPAL